jgi:hypothetical protein
MKLTKKTYLTTDSDKLIDRSFQELGSKTININIASFFETYKDIFYRIPKTGVNSHTTLYNDSGKFIGNPQTSDQLKLKKQDKKIIELQAKISELTHKNTMLNSTNILQQAEIQNIKQS